MFMTAFRGMGPVEWRSWVGVGDEHAHPDESPPGDSFQKRAPRVSPPHRDNQRHGPFLVLRQVMLLAGVLLILAGANPWRQAVLASSWPVVDGKVVQSRHLASSDGQHPFWGSWLHRTRVEYVYVFDRRLWSAERIEFGIGDQAFVSRDFADRIVRRYPVDKSLRVWVNPDHPQEAVLETTPSAGGSLIFLMAGVICLAVRYFLGIKGEQS
ncbi:MAG: DUF3592 domain-containing protein [Magnetococcales bacterium]|nr:DUF3592 domain-containing protein [Magnetococcales bacterium]